MMCDVMIHDELGNTNLSEQTNSPTFCPSSSFSLADNITDEETSTSSLLGNNCSDDRDRYSLFITDP